MAVDSHRKCGLNATVRCVGVCRKGWGAVARWGRSAKGGADLQRTFMSVARWGQNAKGQPNGCPSALSNYHYPLGVAIRIESRHSHRLR